jgi:hypothetical protein
VSHWNPRHAISTSHLANHNDANHDWLFCHGSGYRKISETSVDNVLSSRKTARTPMQLVCEIGINRETGFKARSVGCID